MKRLVAMALTSAMLVSGLMSVLPGLAPTPALAAGRAVTVSTTYPSVISGKGKEISFPITVTNNGSADEWMKLDISASPDGWNPTLKDAGFIVRQVFVASEKSQLITLSMNPPAATAAGEYTVTLRATSTDGVVVSQLDLQIAISPDVSNGVQLTTDYPKLQGAPGSKFEFKMTLNNQSSQDRDIALAASAPTGWVVTFQPDYENKQISSLTVKAGATQGVNVEVQAPTTAAPDTYPVNVTASAGADKSNVDLSITLAGTGTITLTSATGRLNAEANAGSDSVYTLNVQNTGTADMQNITLISSPPDGWTVSYEPAKIAELKAGGTQQVNVHITPSAKAIAGDYVLAIRASSGDVTADQQVRITVMTSGAWGFAGMFVVAIVIAGMVGIYTKLGRR